MATITVTPIKTFTSGETVTPTKLNELAQSTVALTAASIVAADLASDAVTTAKILDANVTTAKILDANVTTAKIADSAVTTAKLNDAAVTTAKINDAAVTAAKLDGAQTGSAPIYGCRAWVNFDGTAGSTVDGEFRCTISGSGNVSKVVRTATGSYTVTFTAAMPDANYAASTGYNIASGVNCCRVTARTSTNCTVITNSGTGGTAANSDSVSVAVFR